MPLYQSAAVCGYCIDNKFNFESITAAFYYKHPIDIWIQRLKARANFKYLPLFSTALLQKIDKTCLPEAIIPVPLAANALWRRGFNQALEIAKPIAQYLDIPVITTAMTRIKGTKAQRSLNRADRITNVSNTFKAKTYLPYRSLAIVDDVVTTTSTVNELASVLQDMGIKTIYVWCCARQIIH